MNKIFKVIWSKTKNSYVVVSEIAKHSGKCSSSLNKKLIAAFLAAGAVMSVTGSAWADPYAAGGGTATGTDAIAIGASASAKAGASTVVGTNSTAGWYLGFQGFGATVFGGFNSNSVGNNQNFKYDGVANSIVGLGNSIGSRANGALIFGAGNKIQNAYEDISTEDLTAAIAAYEAESTTDNYNKVQTEIKKAVAKKGGNTIAIGDGNSISNAIYSTIIGARNTISGSTNNSIDNNIVIGSSNTVQASNNIVIGNNRSISNSSYNKNIIIGGATEAKTTNASNVVALGYDASVTANDAIAIGAEASATGNNSVSVGYKSSATMESGAALGNNTSVTVADGVALGSDSKATVPKMGTTASGGYDISGNNHKDDTSGVWKSTLGAVSVGDPANKKTRQITGVAAGSKETDAVNVAQLKQVENFVEDSKIHYFGVNSTVSTTGSNYNGDGATGTDAIAIGASASAMANASVVVGTNSQINKSNSYPFQSFGAAVFGGYNSISTQGRAETKYDGVANSVVGFGNAIGRRANGALIFGAGNTVENAYKDISTDGLTAAIEAYAAESTTDNYKKVQTEIKKAITKNGGNTIAIGYGNSLKGSGASDQIADNIVIGNSNTTKASNNVVIGNKRAISGTGNIIIDSANPESEKKTEVNNTVALGYETTVSGTNGVALGYDASVTANDAIAIGGTSKASKIDAIAIGAEASATGNNSVSVGYKSSVIKENGTALGNSTSVTVADGVALGSDSKATVPKMGTNDPGGYDISGNDHKDDTSGVWKSTLGAVSVGDPANKKTRQITGVAAGTNDTDAVNVAQLKQVENIAGGAKTHYFGVNSTVETAGSNFDGDGATGTDAIAIGANAKSSSIGSVAVGTNANAGGYSSTVVGAGSVIERGIYNADLHNQGDMGTVFGAHNAIKTVNTYYPGSTDSRYEGVVTSIFGVGNTTESSNGALILGIDNKVIKSDGDLSDHVEGIETLYKAYNSNPSNENYEKWQAALRKAVSESGGNVVAVGNNNLAKFTNASAVIGFGNELNPNPPNGQTNIEVQRTYVIGQNNTVRTTDMLTVIGTGNSVGSYSGANIATDSVILGHDNHIDNVESHNIVIGSNYKIDDGENVIIGTYDATDINSNNYGKSPEQNIKTGKIVSLGYNATASAGYSVAAGYDSAVKAAYGIAIGSKSSVGDETEGNSGYAGVALGYQSAVTRQYGTALGKGTSVTTDAGVALGSDSTASVDKGAVGYDMSNNNHNDDTTGVWKSKLGAVSVGADAVKDEDGNITAEAQTRQIVNLAAGTEDTDAVNVAQLKNSKTHYYSVKSSKREEGSNYEGDGATGIDSIAIGPGAATAGQSSIVIGNESKILGPGLGYSENSIVLGASNTLSQAKNSQAIGNNNSMSMGYQNIVIGDGHTLNGTNINDMYRADYNVILGAWDKEGEESDSGEASPVQHPESLKETVMIGHNADAQKEYAIAIGSGTQAGQNAVSLGKESNAKWEAVAIGDGAQAATHAASLGEKANAAANRSISLGSDSNIAEDAAYGIALGYGSSVTTEYGTALGQNASAAIKDGVALGSNSIATVDASSVENGIVGYDMSNIDHSNDESGVWRSTAAAVSVGGTYTQAVTDDEGNYLNPEGQVVDNEDEADTITTVYTRQITNVAAGMEDTDAVNVAQLKSAKTHYFSVKSTDTGEGTNYEGDGAKGLNSIAIGLEAGTKDIAQRAVAIGYKSYTEGRGSIAMGSNSSVTKDYGVALGQNASVTIEDGVALGSNATTTVDKNVLGYDVLGADHQADTSGVWKSTAAAVSVGGTDSDGKIITRQITSVAAGTKNTDAVNVAQLKNAETHYYKVNDMGVHKDNYYNDGAKGFDSLAIGAGVGTRGNFSSVTGSYSSVKNTGLLQGTGASVYGSFNSVGGGSDAQDGIGNSIVGLANSTSSANGALIFGTGNEITNSIGTLEGYETVAAAYMTYTQKQALYNRTPTTANKQAAEKAYKDLQNAMKEFAKTAPEKGGDVLAIGGANTAKYTTKSSIIGVKNTIEGKVGSEIEYNSAIGYNNTIENGSNNSVIGTNRKVSGADGVVVMGAATDEMTTSAANSVVIGTDANVTLTKKNKESVALGSSSKADKLGGYENPGENDVKIGKLKLNSNDFAGIGDDVVGTVSIGYVPEQQQKSRAVTGEVKTRTLTYVGAGEISKDSTDAINGSQLYTALDAMQFEIVAGDNVEVIKNTDDTGHTVYTIHSLNAMVQAGPSGNVTVTDEVGDGKTNGVTTDLTSDGTGTTTGNGAGAGTTGGTTVTTPEPTPSEDPIGPLAPGEEKPNEHTTVYTVDAKDTYVEKGEVTQAATDDSDKVVTTFTHNYGTTFDVESNNTYVSKAEVTKEATDESADVNVKLIRNDGQSFDLPLKDRYVSKAEVTQQATDESDKVKVQLTRNDGQSFGLDLNNTYVAKAEVTKAATDESDKVKVQLTRNDGKSFDLDLNNTYVAKAEVTQQATDTSDDVTIELSRNDGKSFELATKNTYLANAELKDHTLTLGRNDGTEFVVNDLATLDDGMSYEGDTGSATVKLNNTVSVTGGATELTDGNIGVAASQDGENAKLEIKLAKNIKDVDSITVNKNIKVGDNTTIEGDTITTKTVNADTFKAGDTTINNDGLTINEGPSVTKEGIDAGNKTITNVAPGTLDTDAATVGQLKNESGDIRNEISRLDNSTRKGIAGAAALAALHPMDFNPDDKLQFSAGVGNYRGETAAALGMFYRPDESVMFSIGGTFGNADNMVNAGITFGLDGTRNRITRSRTAMAKEIVELRSLVTQMAARMDRLEGANAETAMFPDVPENHWAYEYVEDLQKRGALKGYPDGLFKGDRAMTRYEFAAMLDRLVRSGVTLDSKIAKEFEPELGRIYVERISGQDNDRKKIERVRVNNSDSKYPEGKNRDVYGSKIVTAVPEKAVAK